MNICSDFLLLLLYQWIVLLNKICMYVSCVCLFCFFLSGSDGTFTRAPSNVTLIPGTLLRLHCGTNLAAPVLWQFTAAGSTSTADMTGLGTLTSEFTPYFYIDSSMQYDLVAWTSNANQSYCGTYACIENDGGGASSMATVASKFQCIKVHSYVLQVTDCI